MMAEETLLMRIGRGDRAAVAPCIEKYSGLVWSLARRFIANEADAEEAVQEIFMELWATASRFDERRSSEATYISMIARRRLIDRLRKLKREPAREPLQHVEHLLTVDGQQALESSAETKLVLSVIETMSAEQQDVVRMSAWLGMSHAAIAERTTMPLGTVKSHLRRGLNKIREQLGEGHRARDGEVT